MGAKRSRGRLKETVLTLPMSSTPLESQSEVTHEKIDEDEGSVSERRASYSTKKGSTYEILIETKAEPESRRLWVDVISDNQNPTKGKSMEYVAPVVTNGEIEVEINDEDIVSELLLWENVLILYVMGENLSMHTLSRTLCRRCGILFNYQIYSIMMRDFSYCDLRSLRIWIWC